MSPESNNQVTLAIDKHIAVITNNRPEKQNAFTDEMDLRLFEIFSELKANKDVRAIIWRGEGKSWSSGRDVSAIGTNLEGIPHQDLMKRGHLGIQQIFDMDIPIIVAIQGWAIGGSFQRSLLCDIRIGAEDARFMLPELSYGVMPDTGGMSCLYEIAGHGLVSDMVFCQRVLSAEEALSYGILSRVVKNKELDETAYEMAEKIVAAPKVSVKLARKVIRHLSDPVIRQSMDEESVGQSFINASSDFAEFKKAKKEERPPKYIGN